MCFSPFFERKPVLLQKIRNRSKTRNIYELLKGLLASSLGKKKYFWNFKITQHFHFLQFISHIPSTNSDPKFGLINPDANFFPKRKEQTFTDCLPCAILFYGILLTFLLRRKLRLGEVNSPAKGYTTKNQQIRSDKISSSAPPCSSDLYNIPLLLRTHQPLALPDVVKSDPSGTIVCGFRKVKSPLKPLEYERYDPKE